MKRPSYFGSMIAPLTDVREQVAPSIKNQLDPMMEPVAGADRLDNAAMGDAGGVDATRAFPVRNTRDARVRLVLADGHPIVLQGMQHLFQKQSDLEILKCCTSEEETLRAVERLQPDILVLDLHLPGRGGLAVIGDLVAGHLPTRVVLLAGSVTEDEMTKALRLGVKGLVLKEMAAGLLVECIRKVNQGAVWLENASVSRCVERMLRRETSLQELKHILTRRELQIVQLAAGGLRNKDIAAKLDITEGTIKIHLHNIYVKLGLKDRLELVFCARDKALV